MKNQFVKLGYSLSRLSKYQRSNGNECHKSNLCCDIQRRQQVLQWHIDMGLKPDLTEVTSTVLSLPGVACFILYLSLYGWLFYQMAYNLCPLQSIGAFRFL